ncbi:MAG: hypothetical protein MJ066_05705 [Clostridia bacterium]|nr:hypothetical protein [Clostridia bacterium]
MIKAELNKKALEDTYKNAHIALQSIDDILPNVNDDKLKDELKEQRNGYQSVMDDVSKYMLENNFERKDINIFKKVMLKSGISMKTMFDKSKNNIAEMMLKGTLMGIIELSAMKNESVNYDDKTNDLINNLLNLRHEVNRSDFSRKIMNKN